MSGEKCGKITVQERSTLFRAVQKLKQARRQRQRERRQKRNEARLEQERRALEDAIAKLEELRRDLESLNARAADFARSFKGIELPGPPQLPEVDEADAGAILAFLDANEVEVARYRSRLNEAMLNFHRGRAVGEGRDEVAEWYGSYAPAASRTAADNAAAAGNEVIRGRQGQQKELRRTVFENARKLMAEVDRKVAHVSDDLRGKLAAVLSAESHGEAQIAEARLKAAVRGELQRVEAEKVRRQKEQKRLQTDRVAALMAQSLEEMGYVVSGVDESAYTRDGQIIACNPEQPGHAVRLTMNAAGQQVRSNVVRLVERGTPAGSRKGEQEEDAKADRLWCHPEGIGRFRTELEKKGVGVEFARANPRGQPQLESVAIEDLIEASPSLDDHFSRARPQLRQRSRDARSR